MSFCNLELQLVPNVPLGTQLYARCATATAAGFESPVTADQDGGAGWNEPEASPIRNDRVPLPGDPSPALTVTMSLIGGAQPASAVLIARIRTPPPHCWMNSR